MAVGFAPEDSSIDFNGHLPLIVGATGRAALWPLGGVAAGAAIGLLGSTEK